MITKNEEKAVGKVVNEIKALLPDAEILIVDSSNDKTAKIAAEAGAKVIKQYPPQGYGVAMDLALRSAKGDVVVTLDCDDTYPVDQILVLANMILKDGFDIVDASRLKKKPKAMPLVNYIANWGFALFASILFGKRLTDLHSGMRAYRKTMIDSLVFETKNAALPVELLLKPLRRNYRFNAIYIDYKERIGVSKMEPLKGAWWTLKRILNVRFSR